MSILSGTGKIYMVREPVCGRFGIHRLLAMLSSNSLNVHWNGIDEVTIVTFNKRKTICNRVGRVFSSALSQHRTCGSAYGASQQ